MLRRRAGDGARLTTNSTIVDTDKGLRQPAPDTVWSLIGQFNLDWHPLVAKVRLIGEGLGQLRRIETRDGGEVVERLTEADDAKRIYRYALVAGIAASHYEGTIEVRPKGSGSIAEWRVQYLADKQPDIAVRTRIATLVKTGLGSLKHRFAAAA